MKSVFIGCMLLLCFVTSTDANQGPTDVDYIVTIIIASTAGGMVLMVLLVLLIRCICLKCKKTPVRNIRPRGPPSYEESRRVYSLPAPPAYSPRDYPLHQPPAYETHLSLPGVAD